MKRLNQNLIIGLAAVALALMAAPISAQEEAAEKSLYDRLGGVYSIATVVDEFLERLLVNDVLNANPLIDAARERVPKAGLKFRVTALVCQLSGGPEIYNGRSMKDAHAHLNINEEQWNELVKVFVEVLTDFKVGEAEQNELLDLVGPTKTDIVTAAATE